MNNFKVRLPDRVSSLTLSDHQRQVMAELAAAKYFGLDWPMTSQDGYCDIGGFLNVQGALDKHQPLVTLEGPLQRLRAHLPIMLVRCHELDTIGRFEMVGWRFRSETWCDKWRRTPLPGYDLPDAYCVPEDELYPVDTLRLLFKYRNPNGTPDMARWPTPDQFRKIMEGCR